MFGHNNNDSNDQGSVQHGTDAPADGTVGSLEPETMAPTAASAPVVTDASMVSSSAATPAYPTGDTPASAPVVTDATPPVTEPPVPTAPTADVADAANASTVTPEAESAPSQAPAQPALASPGESGDLLSLKQSALQELSPLLGHLDQTPEERFRTTMMMIQASDDQNLLQTAYEAAKAISDEKVRAQALLDVVNEINYFTQASTTDAS